jgi:hypothetical protein
MGIKYAYAYSYILSDLTLSDINRIALAQLEIRNNKFDDRTKYRNRPSIDIAVNANKGKLQHKIKY